MKNKMTVADVDIKGKRVIARVDFNVPLDENGNITDDKRIRAALPTIRHIIGQGACLILVSHLGRPKEGPDPKYSMKPAAERLSELLGKEVKLAADVIGEDAKAKAAARRRRGPARKMSASTRKRQRTIRHSRRNWPQWRISMSTTLSVPRTEPMPPRPESRNTFRRSVVF